MYGPFHGYQNIKTTTVSLSFILSPKSDYLHFFILKKKCTSLMFHVITWQEQQSNNSTAPRKAKIV